jgi:beta-D-xylosidase 4
MSMSKTTLSDTMQLVFIWLVFLGFTTFLVSSDFSDGTLVQVWSCQSDNIGQKWVYHPQNSLNIRLLVDGKCLDIKAWDSSNGAVVHLWTCHPDFRPENQWWSYKDGQIISGMDNKCLDIKNSDPNDGAIVQMWDCNGGINQQWILNATDNTIRSKMNGKCLDVGTQYSCFDPKSPIYKFPYCNWTLPTDVRIKDLMSRMQLVEKWPQLLFQAPSVSRLGVPAYVWGNECLHGVLSGCGTRCPTSFPTPPMLAATFDMPLVHRMAQAISTEARALYTQRVCGITFWAPNMNINRDPRWGRNQEVPGEDPYLTSQYIVAFSRGLQEGEDPRYVKVVSTCKHYAAYSLENYKGVDRFHFNANVTDQDFAETYFVAFEACVKQARVRSIMCSYNAVNNIPSCASPFLLSEVLREEWGFDGYVVSDCGAIDCIQNTHHYTQNASQTIGVAIGAGTDLECGGFFNQMPLALQAGTVTEAEIDRALFRLFRQRFELGMFDPPNIQPYLHIPPEVVDSAEHSQLALQLAREGIVLLKRTNSILPISKNATVAVVGPNALAQEVLLGNYHGERCLGGGFSCIQTPLAAIQKVARKVFYAKGCNINDQDKSGFPAAITAAKQANVVVAFLGLDQSQEAEGLDRVNIDLPGVQNDFVKALYSANPNLVVVLINGGAVAIEWIKDNVPGIIEAFYPGENGAQAIADVLFGIYNPSGKLPYTIFPTDYVNQISFFDMNMRTKPGRTYRFYTGSPLWPFGFGLSYTTFTIQWHSFEDSRPVEFDTHTLAQIFNNDEASAVIEFRATVKNVGNLAGDEVVMAFVTRQDPTNGPLKQLFGFQRVHLNPGQSRDVYFSGPTSIFFSFDKRGNKWLLPGSFQIQVTNGNDATVTKDVTLRGLPSLVKHFPIRH